MHIVTELFSLKLAAPFHTLLSRRVPSRRVPSRNVLLNRISSKNRVFSIEIQRSPLLLFFLLFLPKSTLILFFLIFYFHGVFLGISIPSPFFPLTGSPLTSALVCSFTLCHSLSFCPHLFRVSVEYVRKFVAGTRELREDHVRLQIEFVLIQQSGTPDWLLFFPNTSKSSSVNLCTRNSVSRCEKNVF